MDVAQPEVMGFSSERLKRVNTVMQRYIDEKKLAGVVTLLARRDRVVRILAIIGGIRPLPRRHQGSTPALVGR
jgi:hypothetical protein